MVDWQERDDMVALRRRSRLGSFALAITLLLAPVAGAVPATASSTATFADERITEQRGDITTVPVTLSGTDRATVEIEAVDGGYAATVELVDGDEDGRVDLQFNTYLAGQSGDGGPFETESDGDNLTIRDETTTKGLLATGEYELTVRTETNGNPDEAALHLDERRGESLTTKASPRELAPNLTSSTEIEYHDRNGTFETGPVLRDDLLVVRLEASGLGGALAVRESGQNVTERFFEVLESEEVNLTVEQTNPPPEMHAKTLLWNETATTRVVPDASNDTYYLVIDTASVRVDPGAYKGDPPNHWLEISRGEEYRVLFAYGAEPSVWNFDDQPETVASEKFIVERREADLDVVRSDGWLFFEPEANRTVNGRTNVRAGQTLTVRLAVEDAPNRTRTVVVREEIGQNRFDATFDLGDVPDGTNVSVDVRYENRSLLYEPVPGLVATTSGTVEIVDIDTKGSYYSVEVSTNFSRGGFVVLREESADGPRIGKSSYLPPGERGTANVVLEERLSGTHTIVAVAYRDVDADGYYDADDEPYRENGWAVADETEVTFPTTTEPRPETSHVDPPTTNGSPTTTDQSPTTSDGQPGFGFVPLVALLAALAFARRRA